MVLDPPHGYSPWKIELQLRKAGDTRANACYGFDPLLVYIGLKVFLQHKCSIYTFNKSSKLLTHLKGPVVSLILPHLSGFTTSASSAGSQSGSGLEPSVQLLNTTVKGLSSASLRITS